LFNVSEPIDSPAGEKILWKLAKENLPKGKAADLNQALMDLGALICVPKNPRCLICPLMKECQARVNGTQDVRPVKKLKKDVPHFVHAAGVVIKRGKVLIVQRPSTGLLGGMWEFPNGRVDTTRNPAKGLARVLKKGYSLEVRRKEAVGVVEHAYTHFKATVHAFLCEPVSIPKAQNLKWIALSDLDDYPMGRIDRQIAELIKQ